MPADLALRLAVRAARMGQATDEASGNLGFGHVYYALARLYRPDLVVCVGSYRGFAPICFALGLAANRRGECLFIDPGLVDRYWHEPAAISAIVEEFSLHGRLRHLRKTTQAVVAERSIARPIDLLLIDGDHAYAGVKFDFDRLGRLVRRDGLILLHDAAASGRGFTSWEVRRFLEAEVARDRRYQLLTLPQAAGLALVRKLG